MPGRDVRGVKGARLAAEEALGEIGGVPQVEVTDLRPFDADDAEEMSRWHPEGARIARRYDDLLDFAHTGARALVKRGVERRQGLDRVGDDRSPRTAVGGVGRGWRGRTAHGTGLLGGAR